MGCRQRREVAATEESCCQASLARIREHMSRRLQEGGRKGVLGCDGNGSGPARNPGGKGQGQHRPSCGDLLPAAKLDADKAASPTAPGLT